jgi:hypothetical protein
MKTLSDQNDITLSVEESHKIIGTSEMFSTSVNIKESNGISQHVLCDSEKKS